MRSSVTPAPGGPLLGAHVSISEGLSSAPAEGKRIGGEAIQIFSKNQRQWVVKPLAEENAAAFRQAMTDQGIQAAVIHDSYLINLASPSAPGLTKARAAFIDEMERAQMLGVRHLIFHPGAHMGEGEARGLQTIGESLDHCIAKARAPDVVPLAEITAGQGTNVGYTLEHLRELIDRVSSKDRLAVCIDTCHLFQAGYDIRTRKDYDATMRRIDETVGIRQIRAFHLNDAKKPFHSRVDRHEEIGKGTIGVEAFRCLMNDERFAGVPMVLETPEPDRYAKEIRLLRGLRKRRASKSG